MRHVAFMALASLMMLFVSACGSDNYDWYTPLSPGNGSPGYTAPSTIGSDGTGELFTFDVAFDSSPLSEDEEYAADDDDLVENTSFSQSVDIVFSDGAVSYSSLPDDVEVTTTGADIIVTASTSKNVLYHLSGSASDGMFKLYSDKKCAVALDNLSLTNADGPALNIQTKKRVFIVLSDNSTNTLADGATYADTGDEDAKGVIFGEGQLVFSGNGALTITANHNAAISSDQYLRFRRGNVLDITATNGNAVRGKDSLIVSGGVMNIDVSGQGNKGMKSDGDIIITGGRTTILNSAAAYYDTDDADLKGPAGINGDGAFRMSGGTVAIKATGAGGKGISVDGALTISGGTVRVITEGQKYIYGSSNSTGGRPNNGPGSNASSSEDNSKSPKGLRAEGPLTISGGDIMVRTLGGAGAEAIEGKDVYTISGGTVAAYAYDDALNSGGDMSLSGGEIFALSQSNDGIDSNGNMYISGGEIVTIGGREDGVDVVERGSLVISGGTLLSLGATCMTTPSSTSSQPSLTEYVPSLSRDVSINITTADGLTTLFSYTMPLSLTRAYMIMSLPTFTAGTSYVLNIGGAETTVRAQ